MGRNDGHSRLTATQNPSATMKSPMNRKSLAPTSNLGNSLGGFKKSDGLKFNRGATPNKHQEDIEPEVEHERVRTKMDNLDIDDTLPSHQEEEKMQIDE